jgi:uncharacterized integral membrane protein
LGIVERVFCFCWLVGTAAALFFSFFVGTLRSVLYIYNEMYRIVR